MDPETWRQVNDVFHRALEVGPSARTAFVRRECAGDPAILDEVLSLLSAHEHTEQFLAEPVGIPSTRDDAARPRASQRIGQQIGQYRIDRVLGEGGMGVVYQAEDLRLGRVVALKVVSSAVTAIPARRERLRREARAAAALTHPGIATVYALEEIENEIFIAGEFIAGETLREELARGPADAPRVLETAIEIAQALAAAHDRGVIHRDLKPENIIRTPAGHIKILDFGLARVRDLPHDFARLTGTGTVLGTPAYMSPEQIRGESVDGRSDLFSLGILLCELLTGEHPFGGGDPAATIARILETEPMALPSASSGRSASGSIRAGLEGVIRTLMRKAPAARYSSTHELLTVLDRLRSGDISVEAARGSGPSSDALWWWKFHQAATSVFYALVLIPTWLAGQALGERVGLPLFLVAVVAVVAAITLRLHLWFAAASTPEDWAEHQARTGTWLRGADFLLVGALAASGFAVLGAKSAIAVLLVIASVLVLLGAAIIEPSTTRAAFGRR